MEGEEREKQKQILRSAENASLRMTLHREVAGACGWFGGIVGRTQFPSERKPETTMAHDVFISHSAKDKTIADAVCATLESEGIRCWIAPRDVMPGMEYGKSIVGAIKQVRIMVLVLTANANASPAVHNEVERAFNRGVVILTFRVENVDPDESFEFFISGRQRLDALTPPFEAHLNHLAKTIKALLAPIETSAGQAEPRAANPIAAEEEKAPEGKTTKVESLSGASSVEDGSHDPAKGNLSVSSPDSEPEGATAETPKRRRVRVWALGGAVALALVLVAILAIRFRWGRSSAASSPVAAQPAAAGGSGGGGAGQGGSPAAQSPQPGGSPTSSAAPAAGTSPDGTSAGAPGATSAATQELAQEARRLILQKRYSEARHFAEQACDGESADSCVNLGWLYDTGHGVARDESRAASFYQRACDGGSAEGCFNLGADYDTGKGVAHDYAEAASFFQRACDGGSAEGCGDLGELHAKGLGVAQNYPQAASLFQKAFDGGSAGRCGSLGELYAKGLGVAQDSAKGTLLLEKGCSGGDQGSCDRLKQIQ